MIGPMTSVRFESPSRKNWFNAGGEGGDGRGREEEGERGRERGKEREEEKHSYHI